MSKEILARHFQELKNYHNVLNVGLSTKFRAGADTGVPSITVYVRRKLSEDKLEKNSILPKEIEGVPVDVVELNPSTWEAGLTFMSEQLPEHQLNRLGLKEKPQPRPRLQAQPHTKTPSGFQTWVKWCSPIQDQENCGSCTAFGNIGIMEAVIRVAENNPTDPLKLSEGHVFFCSGGTCDGGNTVEAVLNQLLNGVCTEECLPYKDVDQACGAGICANWWLQGKKLSNWDAITDPIEIQSILDTQPMNGTMSVHQSFFNYVSGVYKNLGPSDPVVGGHDIGVVGYSVAMNAYLIRNSWNTTWGTGCVVNGVVCPGYCWIDMGELDPQMQQLIPGGPVPAPSPAPTPTPTPSKCKVGKAVTSVLNIYPRVMGRQGRFYYLNPPAKGVTDSGTVYVGGSCPIKPSESALPNSWPPKGCL